MKFLQKIPLAIQMVTLRLLIILSILSISRVLFYFFNHNAFNNVRLLDFLAGFWFDSITISLIGLPFIILSILPIPYRSTKGYQILLKSIFMIMSFGMILLNIIDIEYFRHTNKRTTIDLFTMLSEGNDFQQQFWSFIRDFWFLLLLLIFLIFILNYLYNKTRLDLLKKEKYSLNKWLIDIAFFIPILLLTTLVGRGGMGLKPISPIDASRFTRVENIALVLNTPFTVLKSIGKEPISEVNFMPLATARTIVSPYKTSKPLNLLPKNTNVVIILLESFGSEFVGASGAEESYTPFLDSLATKSLVFYNGISNGKKSIEGVPSVISAIPSLMDNPYISSPYSNNILQSLPSILKHQGYTSAFFHGATNGSMRFDGFAAQSGFDYYFGRKEYNNNDHFDGTWGILDEYFNPWTAEKLSTFQQPFFATLFTLSSHHPYYIPSHLKKHLKKGKYPICQSIAYGDYSLKRFFQTAQQQSWYSNTIFILCADHTNAAEDALYNQRTEMFKIPIIIFDPSGKIKPTVENEFFQQIDILPTLLDLLNIKTNFYSFGNSYYQRKEGEAITYLEGTYQYFYKDFMITFNGDRTHNLYNAKIKVYNNPDSLPQYKKESLVMEKRLKSIIQQYNQDLISNQMVPSQK